MTGGRNGLQRRSVVMGVKACRRRPRFTGPLRAALLGFILALATTTASDAQAPDQSTPDTVGAFFAVEAPDLGFAVTDFEDARLWSSWRDLGGEGVFGAPVSRRFTFQGQVAQLFERGMLRWKPGSGVSVVNVMDLLASNGYDEQLLSDFGIPASVDWSDSAGLSWPEVQRRHMALLEGPEPWRTALRAAFYTAGEALDSDAAAILLHGLPVAVAETHAGYALRAQRAAWVYAPGIDEAPRRVDISGFLKQTSLVPRRAAVPHGPDFQLPPRPVSAVQFFDWWSHDYLPTEYFTHGLSWERIGITRDQVGSPAYYDANFRLIRDLGVDGVFWEWYGTAPSLTPTPVVLDSLRRHGLKIGLFYDWELLYAGGQAVLSDRAYITPNEAGLSKIADEVIAFYQGIPRDLWLYDADGQLPVIVYAYGFPEALDDAQGWTWFFTELVRRVESALDVDVIFDWSVAYLPPSQVQELAFERWPDDYAPFNFVVDIPQSQYGHHVVTWNYIFDNRGVAERDMLPRLIRDDNRYLQETAWLVAHTNPSLVFIYSWNEFWEGSHLFPDDTYAWRRYELAKAQLAELAATRVNDLPRAVIIGDPADAYPPGTNDLFESQRLLIRHFLRRYVPQATFVTPARATTDVLAGYDLVVSLTTDRAIDPVLAALPESTQIVYWNATDLATGFAQRFVEAVESERPVGRFGILDREGQAVDDTIGARGDVLRVTPAADTSAILQFDQQGQAYPLVVQAGNDHWINIYDPTDAALAAAFEAVYGRALEPAITFALLGNIQRLEVYPDGRVVQNRFSAPAVFVHEPLAIPDFEPAPPEGL
ncbi:MAG: hypothetical protein OXR64_14670 [Chloroflexota bacterium]|nr:hypothetical protein [Chloroflexota bacterium]MDE2921076.1 hypothetical protein [Chloroflexota bacterium]